MILIFPCKSYISSSVTATKTIGLRYVDWDLIYWNDATDSSLLCFIWGRDRFHFLCFMSHLIHALNCYNLLVYFYRPRCRCGLGVGRPTRTASDCWDALSVSDVTAGVPVYGWDRGTAAYSGEGWPRGDLSGWFGYCWNERWWWFVQHSTGRRSTTDDTLPHLQSQSVIYATFIHQTLAYNAENTVRIVVLVDQHFSNCRYLHPLRRCLQSKSKVLWNRLEFCMFIAPIWKEKDFSILVSGL